MITTSAIKIGEVLELLELSEALLALNCSEPDIALPPGDWAAALAVEVVTATAALPVPVAEVEVEVELVVEVEKKTDVAGTLMPVGELPETTGWCWAIGWVEGRVRPQRCKHSSVPTATLSGI